MYVCVCVSSPVIVSLSLSSLVAICRNKTQNNKSQFLTFFVSRFLLISFCIFRSVWSPLNIRAIEVLIALYFCRSEEKQSKWLRNSCSSIYNSAMISLSFALCFCLSLSLHTGTHISIDWSRKKPNALLFPLVFSLSCNSVYSSTILFVLLLQWWGANIPKQMSLCFVRK